MWNVDPGPSNHSSGYNLDFDVNASYLVVLVPGTDILPVQELEGLESEIRTAPKVLDRDLLHGIRVNAEEYSQKRRFLRETYLVTVSHPLFFFLSTTRELTALIVVLLLSMSTRDLSSLFCFRETSPTPETSDSSTITRRAHYILFESPFDTVARSRLLENHSISDLIRRESSNHAANRNGNEASDIDHRRFKRLQLQLHSQVVATR
jgi:hypothetical protein